MSAEVDHDWVAFVIIILSNFWMQQRVKVSNQRYQHTLSTEKSKTWLIKSKFSDYIFWLGYVSFVCIATWFSCISNFFPSPILFSLHSVADVLWCSFDERQMKRKNWKKWIRITNKLNWNRIYLNKRISFERINVIASANLFLLFLLWCPLMLQCIAKRIIWLHQLSPDGSIHLAI